MSDVSTPEVSEAITGPGQAQSVSAVDLDAAGYVQEEHFVSGEARAFAPVGEWTTDGE